ncbi:MAG: DUF2335 domain-containing protein [Candidatus Omnitrophota bacterium]
MSPDAIPVPQNPQESQPSAKKNRPVILQQTEMMGFCGPIPPPEVLAGYERIMPGAADRIIAMAERQAAHRQEMERRIVFSETFQAKIGMFLAFVVVFAAMVAGTILLILKIPVGGLIILIDAITVIALALLNLKRSKPATSSSPPSDARS